MTSEITFTLPRPPSGWKLYNGTGTSRRKTARYRTWIAAADAALYEAKVKPKLLPPPYALLLEFGTDFRSNADVSNFIKVPEDYLKTRGFIVDDSLIDDNHQKRRRGVNWKGVRVTVRSLAEISEAAE